MVLPQKVANQIKNNPKIATVRLAPGYRPKLNDNQLNDIPLTDSQLNDINSTDL